MATINITLRKNKKIDGSYPLAVRITKDRKSTYILLGHSVLEKDWDAKEQKVKRSHPNSARLNNLLLQKKAEANDQLLEMETKTVEVISSKSIHNKIKKEIKPGGAASFFDQAQIFTDNLKKNGKFNRYTTDIGRIKIFREFLKGNDISFPEITVNLMNQFRAWLKSTRDISERTIINYLLLIRTIYNQAAHSGLTDKKNYPFGKGKVVIKFPDSKKVGLTEDEVRMIENLSLEGYPKHARDLWLVSFYFAGMRLSDLMRMTWTDLKAGRIYYGMTKNTKVDSLKIPEKAWAIIQNYKEASAKFDLVFPEIKVLDKWEEYEVQRIISQAGKNLDKHLKRILKSAGIDKNISMHITRHSFAQIAGDKIPVQLLQKLYRHSKIETTIGYQSHFSNKHTDDALDKVLSF
jgi:integrase